MTDLPVDQYLIKLNTLQPKVKSMLRQIRELDLQVLRLQTDIQEQREGVLQKIVEYEENKSAPKKTEINLILKDINQKHEKLMNLTKQKLECAEKIYNQIDEPAESLEEFLTSHPDLEDLINDSVLPKGKSKRAMKENGWEEDIAEPKYCYCDRPYFGYMMMCDNPYCEKEWFHLACIEDNQLDAEKKWYCKNCQKSQKRGRIARKKEKY